MLTTLGTAVRMMLRLMTENFSRQNTNIKKRKYKVFARQSPLAKNAQHEMEVRVRKSSMSLGVWFIERGLTNVFYLQSNKLWVLLNGEEVNRSASGKDPTISASESTRAEPHECRTPQRYFL